MQERGLQGEKSTVNISLSQTKIPKQTKGEANNKKRSEDMHCVTEQNGQDFTTRGILWFAPVTKVVKNVFAAIKAKGTAMHPLEPNRQAVNGNQQSIEIRASGAIVPVKARVLISLADGRTDARIKSEVPTRDQLGWQLY
ncbi:hypothetical protein J6590_010782 [Homalodisca vitripennis]|nr:hypothetical protein J6590_010782 [Homalodisca vitripennis]